MVNELKIMQIKSQRDEALSRVLDNFFSHFIEHCLCVLILSIFICSDTLHSLDGVERQPLLSMSMSLETIYSGTERHTEKVT